VPIRLGLKVSSSVASSDLLISIAPYTEPDGSALASRDEFDATLAGQFAGLTQLSPATFTPSFLRRGHGYVDLYVGGSGIPGAIPAKVPGNQVFPLPCFGGCDGVYPLQVSLDDTVTGTTLDSFTTYLIVVPPTVPAQKKLRFSFIVPVGATIALSAPGNSEVPSRTLEQIRTIAKAAASWPGARLTVDLYGQTLLALARSPDHSSLLAEVTSGGLHALISGPFSAVDPTALVRAGLGAELARQVARSRELFGSVLHEGDASSVYIATSPVGTRGLAALASYGIKEMVLPASNLQSVVSAKPAAVQWPYSISAPFHIAGSKVEGLEADSGLETHVTGSGSPALRAQQLLADLGELYFDSPNYPQPRGVALVAPPYWTPEPAFIDAALAGLQSSPIVAAVPVEALFQKVPPGACDLPPTGIPGCSPAVRSIMTPTIPANGNITFDEVQSARSKLAELASVIPTARGTIGKFDDAVLLAETSGLDPTVRQAYLSTALAMLHELGSRLSLPSGRTVTVTSSSARFPIAVTSNSRAPLHLTLVISGSNLTSATTSALVLHHGTTGFIVRVKTRTSGDSSLDLQLLSPSGGLELANAQFTIRSTAISGVAIGLTVGAGAFLLVWWLRSAVRRSRRAAKHARNKPREPAAAGTVAETAS
jgi:hypothetical protein